MNEENFNVFYENNSTDKTITLSFNISLFYKTKHLLKLLNYSFDGKNLAALGSSFPHSWHIYSMIFSCPTDCPEQND